MKAIFSSQPKSDSEAIVFMARHAHGLVSSPYRKRMRKLGLSLITDDQSIREIQTAFATPIDAREGVGSGMSAFDRART